MARSSRSWTSAAAMYAASGASSTRHYKRLSTPLTTLAHLDDEDDDDLVEHGEPNAAWKQWLANLLQTVMPDVYSSGICEKKTVGAVVMAVFVAVLVILALGSSNDGHCSSPLLSSGITQKDLDDLRQLFSKQIDSDSRAIELLKAEIRDLSETNAETRRELEELKQRKPDFADPNNQNMVESVVGNLINPRLKELQIRVADTSRTDELSESLQNMRQKLSFLESKVEAVRTESLYEQDSAEVEGGLNAPDVERLIQEHLAAKVGELVDSSARVDELDKKFSSMLDRIVVDIRSHSSSISHLSQEVQTLSANPPTASRPGDSADLSSTIPVMQAVVDAALEKYSADKTGLVDHGLESAGGSIMSSSETYLVPLLGSSPLSIFSVFAYPSRSPHEIIRPEMNPGRCWPMKGRSGWAVIRTLRPIRPALISVEHISPLIAQQFSSAPKDMRIFALVQPEGEPTLHSIDVGAFRYQVPVIGHVPTVQIFALNTESLGGRSVQAVNVSVESNHGNTNYTCIYRIRIHEGAS